MEDDLEELSDSEASQEDTELPVQEGEEEETY